MSRYVSCTSETFDHAKQSATDAFKHASKRAIQKTGEAIGDLIGNKIAYTRVSKISQENNSEIVTNDNNKEIPKDIYIYIKKSN